MNAVVTRNDMNELEVVIVGIIENIDTEKQKIQLNNKGRTLEFWMMKEEINNIAVGQEIEITLVIPCDDEDFTLLRGYIKKDLYDFVMQFYSVPGVSVKCADSIYTYLRSKGMSRRDICFEISNGNSSIILERPGLRKEVAYRIVEELRNKINSFETFDVSAENTDKYTEVIKELESLGFMKTDILKALSEINIDNEMQTIDIIQAVIRKIQ